MATELANPQADRAALTLDGQVFEISKSVTFEAAHRLPNSAPGHPYGRIHGHSFVLEATVSGRVEPGRQWVEDLAVVADALARVAARLDHQLLNEIEGLETPTLERIAVWAADQLRSDLPSLSAVAVARPSLNERCTLRLAT